jgi:Phytanoyl-CoA dioxygenase (PhyH)
MTYSHATANPPPGAENRVTLKEMLRTAACLVVLPLGLIAYAFSGKTSGRAYQAFIWLACVTGGRSNTLLSSAVSRLRRAKPIERPVGVLGDLSNGAGAALADQLKRDGYIVFERALPTEVCDRLLDFARSTPAKVRRMDGETAQAADRTALFAGKDPVAVRYDYRTDDLLNNPDVQGLLADRSLLNLTQQYLDCQPVADVLSMWWHTNFHDQPDSEAAQYFHFDMDRIKWLKVFIYLSDVGPDNGPHSFVVGSHRDGGIPWNLGRKGYSRLSDEEVVAEYGADRCLSLTAPRGSIIVEDTRGLHKGNAVRGDARLILQLQFSNSLFGGYYPPAHVSRVQNPDFQARLNELPGVYRQYV